VQPKREDQVPPVIVNKSVGVTPGSGAVTFQAQPKPVMDTGITPPTGPVTMAGNAPATLELLTRESVEAERRARERPDRAKGATARWSGEQEKLVTRNQRIKEAVAAGMPAKTVGADKSIIGDKELSASQVRKIANKPIS
jgi:hypothetical protein